MLGLSAIAPSLPADVVSDAAPNALAKRQSQTTCLSGRTQSQKRVQSGRVEHAGQMQLRELLLYDHSEGTWKRPKQAFQPRWIDQSVPGLWIDSSAIGSLRRILLRVFEGPGLVYHRYTIAQVPSRQ